MKLLLAAPLALLLTVQAFAGEIKMVKDEQSGMVVYQATQGDMAISLVPEAGCNVYSIRHRGVELLKTPESLKDLPGFVYGNPVLYPTPNRVRSGVMTFEGKQFRFEPNNNGNFLHGLVHNVPWEVVDSTSGQDHTTIVCRLDFKPGTEWYKKFPLKHAIELTIKLTGNAVRFTYTVDNSKGEDRVPYGFAFHPWFLYQGSRASTVLTIPATHLMESKDLLPTGKLLPLEGTEFDARQGKSLEGFVIDDVYAGMQESQPTVIDFQEKKLKITLTASDDFKRLVVYTPKDEPWFCVENQTNSTDAHNLYARGLKEESNLLIVEPGQKSSGYAEFSVANY